MKKIKIKYFSDKIDKIQKLEVGDWIDLRSSVNTILKKDEFALIPLGVGMILPKNYEANVVPRSSTNKNFGIIQANHYGVVDNIYCGNDDQWFFPAIATRDTNISVNDRICQFRINKKQPKIKFIIVDKLKDKNRGGHGSTGIN